MGRGASTMHSRKGRFELFRQSSFCRCRRAKGAHYELLLRQPTKPAKIVAPYDFITAAERYGSPRTSIAGSSKMPFAGSCRKPDEREKLAMCSINLSRRQSLGDDKFLPYVIDQFTAAVWMRPKICFEITETAAIASFSQANRFIQALKGARLQIRAAMISATGPLFVRLPQALPGRLLGKSTGSFVKADTGTIRSTARWCARSIEIGHLTGKQTIAEVAENCRQSSICCAPSDVDYAQGYGVSQPQRSAEGGEYRLTVRNGPTPA